MLINGHHILQILILYENYWILDILQHFAYDGRRLLFANRQDLKLRQFETPLNN